MSRNPFAAFQREKIANRVSLIETHLKELAQHRTKFSYITDLADTIAVHLGKIEETTCHRTTLLRNKAYKTLLVRYMEQNCKGAIIPAKLSSDASSQLAITKAELEAANLQREVERLKLYISTLERKLDVHTRKPSLNAPSHPLHSDKSMEFALTCKALALVISHLNYVLILSEAGEIVNASKKTADRVIVDAKTAKPFVAWLKNESVDLAS